MTDIRFALAQIDTCVGDLDSNADKVMRYAHLAAQQGAQVVVFPEMTLTGYPIEDLALRATFRKAAWDKANWLATELASDSLGELYVVVGTVGTDRDVYKRQDQRDRKNDVLDDVCRFMRVSFGHKCPHARVIMP